MGWRMEWKTNFEKEWSSLLISMLIQFLLKMKNQINNVNELRVIKRYETFVQYLLFKSTGQLFKSKIHVWDNMDNMQTWSVKRWSDEN